MSDHEEYKFYIKDQREDSILEPQYQEMGKRWSYRYCSHLERLLPNFNFASADILDLGCREFFTFLYFQGKYDNRIKGMDVCEKAKELTVAEGRPFIDCDAHSMETAIKNESLDMIMCFHAFEHMYDLPAVLAKCWDALKPGGYLYFAVPIPCRNEKRGHWYDIPSVEFMDQLCQNLGFKQIEARYHEAGFLRDENEMIGLYQK
jgi:SAM-dependent methyltransferase